MADRYIKIVHSWTCPFTPEIFCVRMYNGCKLPGKKWQEHSSDTFVNSSDEETLVNINLV